MKAVGKLSDDQRVHQMVAAYCSDYSLVGTLLLPHGIATSDPRLIAPSLDHCMYFHHPFRAGNVALLLATALIIPQMNGYCMT